MFDIVYNNLIKRFSKLVRVPIIIYTHVHIILFFVNERLESTSIHRNESQFGGFFIEVKDVVIVSPLLKSILKYFFKRFL